MPVCLYAETPEEQSKVDDALDSENDLRVGGSVRPRRLTICFTGRTILILRLRLDVVNLVDFSAIWRGAYIIWIMCMSVHLLSLLAHALPDRY